MLLFFSFSCNANNDLIGNKLLCSKLLWGFEFISSDQVKVISTNYNEKTIVKKYYYTTDFELPYINLYLNKKETDNAIFSIHRETHRVDIWTMTSGGNTTREIIPAGFCEYVKIDNMVNYIQELKKLN